MDMDSGEAHADWLVRATPEFRRYGHDALAAATALAFATSTAVRIKNHGGPLLQREIRVRASCAGSKSLN